MKLLVLFVTFSFSINLYVGPFKIIVRDDRVQITNKNARAFHESVGYLTIRIGNRLAACTATVISPRHAVTSALIDRGHEFN